GGVAAMGQGRLDREEGQLEPQTEALGHAPAVVIALALEDRLRTHPGMDRLPLRKGRGVDAGEVRVQARGHEEREAWAARLDVERGTGQPGRADAVAEFLERGAMIVVTEARAEDDGGTPRSTSPLAHPLCMEAEQDGVGVELEAVARRARPDPHSHARDVGVAEVPVAGAAPQVAWQRD